MEAEQTNFDVIVVGAGISGIGAGYHLQKPVSYTHLRAHET